MIHFAVDLEAPLAQIYLGRIGVAADKEAIDGRDPIGEAVQRHFQIFRPGRAHDHARWVGLIGGSHQTGKDRSRGSREQQSASDGH